MTPTSTGGRDRGEPLPVADRVDEAGRAGSRAPDSPTGAARHRTSHDSGLRHDMAETPSTESGTATVVVAIERMDPQAEVPKQATPGAAGFDLSSRVALVLQPGERALVPTGLRMAIPVGFEGQVRPRSGLALKHGITVLNAPGTIDSDYRGEVGVILINQGHEAFPIEPGTRVAQLVIAPVSRATFSVVAGVDQTQRGTGGFGSTGR